MDIQLQLNEIMATLNQIEYGFKDDSDFNLINNDEIWQQEFYKFYYLLSPDELLSKKCGVCWDQVELERKLFTDNNIECHTYFIYLNDQKQLPSHTFLTFFSNNKVYWFEHAWNEFRGIHEYNNLIDLLKDIKTKFINNSHVENKLTKESYIYEYQKPKYHIICEEFYNFIKSQKLIEIN